MSKGFCFIKSSCYQKTGYSATKIPVIISASTVKPGDILNIDFSISNSLVTTPFLVSYLLIKYITIRQIRNTKPIRSTNGIS